MKLKCEAYDDCFNCTLSNCVWRPGQANGESDQCVKYPNAQDETELVTVQNVFLKGAICQDPLNFCGYMVKTPMNSVSMVNKTMRFRSDEGSVSSTFLPAGYFCIYNES